MLPGYGSSRDEDDCGEASGVMNSGVVRRSEVCFAGGGEKR